MTNPSQHTLHSVGRLTLVHAPMPHARTASLAFGTRCGHAFDPAGLEGLAHLGEHMVFRGGVAEQCDAEDAGVTLNAYTGADLMMLQADATSATLPLAVRAFDAMLADRRAHKGFLDAERSIVLEEMATDDFHDDDAVDAALFGGHPYARPAIGTKRSLARMTTADLTAWRDAAFPAEGAHLVVAGDVPLEHALAVATMFERHLADEASRTLEAAVFHAGRSDVRDRRGRDAACVTMAWNHPEDDLRRSAARDVAIGALADAPRSPLARRLREELGLCYSLSTGGDRRMASSHRHIRFDTRPVNRKRAIEELLATIAAAPSLIDTRDVHRAVATERMDRLRSLDNPSTHADDLARALCTDHPEDGVVQAVSEDLSVDEVIAEAEILAREPHALVVVR
jgi:predicted Zn-dependent peptidase